MLTGRSRVTRDEHHSLIVCAISFVRALPNLQPVFPVQATRPVSSADGRIVSCLEGGYNLSALGRSVAAHVKALSEG